MAGINEFVIVVMLLQLVASNVTKEGSCKHKDILLLNQFHNRKMYYSGIQHSHKHTQTTKSTLPYFSMPQHITTRIPNLPKPAPISTTSTTTTTTFTTFLPQEPEYAYYQYINRLCGYRYEECLRIYNSEGPVPQGKWPWMAAIFHEDAKDFTEIYCTGALISKRYVLSDGEMFLSYLSKTFVIRLGDVWFRSVYEEVPHQNFKTKSIKVDDKHEYKTEFALLELNRPAYFDRAVRPICLPIPKEIRNVRGDGYLAGWGETKSGGPKSPFLRDIKVTVISCGTSDPKFSICTNPIQLGQVTLIYQQVNIDVLFVVQSDAGGPVMYKGGHKGQFYFIAVVDKNSLGSPGQKFIPYDHVTPFIDWIIHNSDLSQPWKPDWD